MKMTAQYSAVSIEITYRFLIVEIPIGVLLYQLICQVKMLRQEVSELRGDQQVSNLRLKKTTAVLCGPSAQKIKPEIEIGDLATYSDGLIRFKGSVIPMRDQLNDLCRIFMSRPNQLVLCDEIREEIIRAERRERTRFSTIAKYVSELHGLLKPCFGKDVLFNHKKEGWRFVP